MVTLEYLAKLYEQNKAAAAARVKEFTLGDRLLDFNQRPRLMGVINLSPDSWYRESVCLTAEAAIRRGRVLVAQGADMVDVGAESTLAHAARAGETLQASKLLPVVRGLAETGVAISVETYLPEVARTCLAAGAGVLNLTGTEDAETMYALARDHGAAVILCYVQGPNVREVGDFQLDEDPIPRMYEYFAREVERATGCGLEKIIIDPGLGFYYRNLQDSAVRVSHQARVFLNTFRLRTLGFPVCHALPHAFEFFGDEVRSAEPFFGLLALLGKTDLLRTHELPRIRAVVETLRAMSQQK